MCPTKKRSKLWHRKLCKPDHTNIHICIMYICICRHTDINTHTHTQTHFIYIYRYRCRCRCRCMCMCISISVCIICMSICIYICVCVCVCVHIIQYLGMCARGEYTPVVKSAVAPVGPERAEASFPFITCMSSLCTCTTVSNPASVSIPYIYARIQITQ